MAGDAGAQLDLFQHVTLAKEWRLVTAIHLRSTSVALDQVADDRAAGDASGFFTGVIRFGERRACPVAVRQAGGLGSLDPQSWAPTRRRS